MGLVLKYVQDRGGHWRYRRRVPEELRGVLDKREIVLPLGSSKAEALRRYPAAHADAESRLDAARQMAAGGEGPKAKPKETPLEAYHRTSRRVQELGFDASGADYEETEGARDAAMETMLKWAGAEYGTDPETGYPRDTKPGDTALYAAIGSQENPPPPPTLEDAKRIYLQDKAATGTAGRRERKAQEQRAARVIAHAVAALGGDRELTSLRRADARKVRDHMLAALNSPATVERYLNDLRAIINHAARELELQGFSNPFRAVLPSAPRTTPLLILSAGYTAADNRDGAEKTVR
jgi:hypothetical protein